MIQITEEKIEQLYNKQNRALKTVLIMKYLIIALIVADILCTWFRFSGSSYLKYSFFILFVPLVIITFQKILINHIRTTYMPSTTDFPEYKNVYERMQTDLCSAATVSFTQNALRSTPEEPQKLKLAEILATIYIARGQLEDAEALLRTAPRGSFRDHPENSISFYSDYMSLYSLTNDTQSIEAIYRDLEPALLKCYDKNYVYCLETLSVLETLYTARGEYETALRYQLMSVKFYMKFRQSTSSHLPTASQVNDFSDGTQYFTLAKCYYNCGDYENAKIALADCKNKLTVSPFFTKLANELSEKINQKLY